VATLKAVLEALEDEPNLQAAVAVVIGGSIGVFTLAQAGVL
jgi:hypothetical protein